MTVNYKSKKELLSKEINFCRRVARTSNTLGVRKQVSGFGGPGVSALAFVRGFKPGRSRRIFQDEKILSAPSFGREVKPWVPCR
jgi:hypothetical protein